MPEERLQKIIAASGRCSRREAEELIREGRVRVNGHVAELGQKADASRDHIKVDGKRIAAAESRRWILMYKPRQVVTTCSDPEERRTVIDLLGNTFPERLYPVGRLDYQSEGLLLLTNDGELAAKIAHPRYGLIREYRAKIRGDLSPSEIQRLRRGASIDGVRVIPKTVHREHGTREGNSWWRIEVGEGRTHEVRELFFRVGHPVQRLRRMSIGPIRDEHIKAGQFRELTRTEIDALRKATRKMQAQTKVRKKGQKETQLRSSQKRNPKS